MKKLRTWLVTLPLIAIASLLAVANRQRVGFSFDPLSPSDPLLPTVEAPFYVYLFAALIVGTVIGGMSSWIAAGRVRNRLRRLRREARAGDKAAARARLPAVVADGTPRDSPPPR